MAALIEVILPVFLVIGAGYAAVWRDAFSDSAVDGLMLFVQRFAIPSLLFLAIARLDLQSDLDLRLLGAYYAGSMASFLAGLAGARLLFGRPLADAVAIGFACMFCNTVLLGLPITERAYGPDALGPNYAIIAFHAPFCYFVGITAMELVRARASGTGATGFAPKVLKAMFSNALILGIAAGYAVNLMQIPVPGVVIDALELMVRAAIPAALFGLGGVLYRYRPEGDLRQIAFMIGVSLLMHPIIVYALGTATALTPESLRSAVITAAMPAGVNAYIFANMYGVAKRVAASTVLIGTGASLLTSWMWLTLLP